MVLQVHAFRDTLEEFHEIKGDVDRLVLPVLKTFEHNFHKVYDIDPFLFVELEFLLDLLQFVPAEGIEKPGRVIAIDEELALVVCLL